MASFPEQFRLDGKVAIVGGVGDTNSKHIALALAEAGADVALVARTTAVTEDLARDLRAIGRKAIALVADLSDSVKADRMVAAVRHELGRIDVLFNNAGSGGDQVDILDMSDEQWKSVMAGNLDTTFYATRAVARVMVEQGAGGAIINTSSTASRMAPPHLTPYSVAKAGVNQLTRACAVELAPHNIRVNCMLFGTYENAGPHLNDIAPGFGDWWLRETPMHRFGKASESAGTALYLASQASAYVTGAIIPVSGGMGLYG